MIKYGKAWNFSLELPSDKTLNSAHFKAGRILGGVPVDLHPPVGDLYPAPGKDIEIIMRAAKGTVDAHGPVLPLVGIGSHGQRGVH